MTLTLMLPPEVEARLLKLAQEQSLPVEAVALQILTQRSPSEQRRSQLMALLRSWIGDGGSLAATDEADEFLKALDEDRLGERPLYPAEIKGVTW